MNFEGMAENANHIDAPPGLQEFLQSFVVAILRNKPDDLLDFAAEYFNEQLDERNAQNGGGGGTLPGMDGTVAFRPGEAGSDHGASDDGSDEGMCEEEEARLMQRANMARRKSVSAEGYDPEAEDEDDEPHVVHGKSDEQRKRLTKVVEPMLLFKSLDADQFSQILDAMFEKVVEPGDVVIKEGDDGDYFYIIESGKYDIFKIIGGENKHVGQYDNKGSFGELALMYNAPRAATITAHDGGSLWAMDRQTFRRIVVKETAKKRRVYEGFLEKVEVLATLTADERTKIADAIEQRNYTDGDEIITQGDSPDYFYIVQEGIVDIKRRGDDKNHPSKEAHLCSLTEGKYFGELAFLTNKPRAASVYARGNVKCACLDVQAFERLLGPCKKLLERNMEMYDKQLSAITQHTSDN